MAKRTREENQAIALKTNISKWSKAIKKATGNTEVFEVVELTKDDWDKLVEADRWAKISEYRKEHPEIKLERNRKEPSIDFKDLAIKAAEATNEEERNKIIETIKKYKEYEDAKSALESATANFEKAKKRLSDARERFKQLADECGKLE